MSWVEAPSPVKGLRGIPSVPNDVYEPAGGKLGRDRTYVLNIHRRLVTPPTFSRAVSQMLMDSRKHLANSSAACQLLVAQNQRPLLVGVPVGHRSSDFVCKSTTVFRSREIPEARTLINEIWQDFGLAPKHVEIRVLAKAVGEHGRAGTVHSDYEDWRVAHCSVRDADCHGNSAETLVSCGFHGPNSLRSSLGT
jgi:hypothetical protein